MLSGIPLVGDIIAGGRGQGVIGLTFALGGNVDRPHFQVNPVSAIAPGILRKFFEYGGPATALSPQAVTMTKRLERLHQHMLLLAHGQFDGSVGIEMGKIEHHLFIRDSGIIDADGATLHMTACLAVG